jgi:predicted DNA-binding protein
MDTNKQLELEALAAVGEMLLFDKARGNPEEAERIMRCARIFVRSDDAAQRLSELCTEAGSNATWHEKTVDELEDREDLQAAETVMQRIRSGEEKTSSIEDVIVSLDADDAEKEKAEPQQCRYEIDKLPTELGGGWRLRLLENGDEVGGGVFPLSEYVTAENAEEAASYAYEDALAEASAWLASRSADEEPAFLDDKGPSDDLPTRFTLSRKGQA